MNNNFNAVEKFFNFLTWSNYYHLFENSFIFKNFKIEVNTILKYQNSLIFKNFLLFMKIYFDLSF